MINIRKLVAVALAWLGAKVIVTEYSLGVSVPFLLGLVLLRRALSSANPLSWITLVGIWLVTIAINFVPLLTYAVVMTQAGTAKAEGQLEIVHAKRYGIQQAIVLVPLLVVSLALWQEYRGRKQIK